MSIAFALFFTFVLFVYRTPLLSIFTNDSNVLQIAADAMSIIAPFYIAFTFIEVYSVALRAMGDVIVPLVMTTVGICVFRIAWVIFVVPLSHTMSTISFNYPISWVMTGLGFIVYYVYRIRKLDNK
jgi:Na+-driven multidrug efflux pump